MFPATQPTVRTESGDPVLVGGVPATALAARFGTPLYAYDAASIRRRLASLRGGIRYEPLRVYYSCKANPAIGILRLLRELGVGIDVCSPGDIVAATRAGYADGMSYVGIGTSGADLDAVVASGAFYIADSVGEVDRYADRSPIPTDIGLRVNPCLPAEANGMLLAGSWDAKFGIHPGQIAAVARRARDRGLRVIGLHAHIGSDLAEPGSHLATLGLLLELAVELDGVRFVSLGGGMAVAAEGVEDFPVEQFGAAAADLLNGFARLTGRRIELRLEPGSYLVMDAGVLLTRVTDVKPPINADGRMTPRFACVDSSYNHVVSAVFHGVNHPIRLARDPAGPPGRTEPVTIVGNLMQAGDILARDRLMPQLAVGDVLVVGRCGAYTSSLASTFNERPRPAEVIVDGERTTLVRRAETPEDLFVRDTWQD